MPDELTSLFSSKVLGALKELLERKHLYQSVVIPVSWAEDYVQKAVSEHRKEIELAGPNFNPGALGPAESAQAHLALLHKKLRSLNNSPWEFEPEAHPQGLKLQLSSIKISCNRTECSGMVQPHNFGYVGLQEVIGAFNFGQKTQVFSLPYQCQSCRGEPVIFMVRRDELKITLVGRSQFPEVSVPDFIPKNLTRFYRNAVIADQTGFVLAAALYFRSLIEQHFRSVIPESEINQIKGNPTGSELAEMYSKTLPKAFPGSFPSLGKAYDDLSVIIHSGKEDDKSKELLQRTRAAIENHYEALRLFQKIAPQIP